jgi:hypothetical protein
VRQPPAGVRGGRRRFRVPGPRLTTAALLLFFASNAGAQGLGYAIAGPAASSGFVNTNTTFHAAGRRRSDRY